MATNSTGLMANVTNGVLNYTASSEKTGEVTERGSQDLGKDAFLQLLVCQMQNQDPLEPSTDTEYVSQLAQFSQLEQLQNLSGESEKSQAFTLVGRYVVFEVKDAKGKTTYPEGTVDFVNMASGGKVKLSVNGTTYDYEDLYTVVDDVYFMQQNIPKIAENYNFAYNGNDPEDIVFEVNYGNSDYKATEAAVLINGEPLDRSYLTYHDNTVTISKEAFAGLANGDYAASIVFNNSIYTTVNDKVKITVFNSKNEGEWV